MPNKISKKKINSFIALRWGVSFHIQNSKIGVPCSMFLLRGGLIRDPQLGIPAKENNARSPLMVARTNQIG
jgi:hypothetical protein